jgi:hypothetical protein
MSPSVPHGRSLFTVNDETPIACFDITKTRRKRKGVQLTWPYNVSGARLQEGRSRAQLNFILVIHNFLKFIEFLES